MQVGKWTNHLALLMVASLLATGCAPPNAATPDYQAIDQDPLEPFNRGVYQFNYTLDGVILRPAASIYRGVVPEKGRELVSNFIENLYTPVVFANSLLQLDPENTFSSFWRFFLNTTVGIGGLFDVATEAGLKTRPADFGQTLAIYGADTGPYLVLPIIGPSNGRDAIGRIADALMNPFNHIDEGLSYSIWAATAINQRSNNMKLIDDVYNNSLDPYTTFRSGYTQKRAADIRRAKTAREKSQGKALNPQ